MSHFFGLPLLSIEMTINAAFSIAHSYHQQHASDPGEIWGKFGDPVDSGPGTSSSGHRYVVDVSRCSDKTMVSVWHSDAGTDFHGG